MNILPEGWVYLPDGCLQSDADPDLVAIMQGIQRKAEMFTCSGCGCPTIQHYAQHSRHFQACTSASQQQRRLTELPKEAASTCLGLLPEGLAFQVADFLVPPAVHNALP